MLVPSKDQHEVLVFLCLFRVHDPFHDRPRMACMHVDVFLFSFQAEKVLSSWFVACFIDSREFLKLRSRAFVSGHCWKLSPSSCLCCVCSDSDSSPGSVCPCLPAQACCPAPIRLPRLTRANTALDSWAFRFLKSKCLSSSNALPMSSPRSKFVLTWRMTHSFTITKSVACFADPTLHV